MVMTDGGGNQKNHIYKNLKKWIYSLYKIKTCTLKSMYQKYKNKLIRKGI